MMRLSLLACAVLAVSSASFTPYPTNKPVQRSSTPQGRRTSRSGQHSSAKLIEGSEDTIEPYSKHQPGRHVCTQEQAVTEPVRSRESYCRPVYKTLPCENGKICRRYRLVYETAYRDVLKMRVSRKTAFSCCPGWAQGSKANHGCTKAVCTRPCENGGACLKPEFCGCRPGYTGKHCEIDVNECTQNNSCEHVCVNTLGSYQCRCRDGFTLQPDGRSCRGPPVVVSSTPVPEGSRDREELEDDDGEERDLSVEFIYLTKRISKLEKIMSKPHTESPDSSISLSEVTAKLDKVLESISSLKTRVDRMERRVDHHHRALRKNSEDNKLQSVVHKLALLDYRMDRCACSSDSANKINV